MTSKPYKTRLSFVDQLVIAFYTISPFLYLVRVLYEDELLTNIALRFMEPLLVVVLSGLFLLRRHSLDYFSMILICFLLYGAVLGFIRGNEIQDVLAGMSHFIFGILVYLHYKNKTISYAWIKRFFFYFSAFALSAVSCVIALIYLSEIIFGRDIYIGLASQSLLPVFFYGLGSGNLLISIVAVFLIFLSGKRGVLLSLIAAFTFHLLIKISRLRFNFKSTVSFFLLGLVGVYIVYISTPILTELLAKYTLNDFNDLNTFSSGRLNEIISALLYWTSEQGRFYIGAGFGFNYTYIQSPLLNLPDIENYKNVHFSWLNPLISFGLILGVIYLFVFFAFVLRTLLFNASPIASALNFHKYTIVALVIYASFVFIVFNEPILYLLLGLMNSRKLRLE